jgi:hypothetical protein
MLVCWCDHKEKAIGVVLAHSPQSATAGQVSPLVDAAAVVGQAALTAHNLIIGSLPSPLYTHCSQGR